MANSGASSSFLSLENRLKQFFEEAREDARREATENSELEVDFDYGRAEKAHTLRFRAM